LSFTLFTIKCLTHFISFLLNHNCFVNFAKLDGHPHSPLWVSCLKFTSISLYVSYCYFFSPFSLLLDGRCMSKNNSSRNGSVASTIKEMQRKRILRGCSRKSVRRWRRQLLVLLLQRRNGDSWLQISSPNSNSPLFVWYHLHMTFNIRYDSQFSSISFMFLIWFSCWF